MDDDIINDPKILLLPEAMRWIWVAFLCIASKNDGTLPKIEILALSLRVKTTKAAEYLTRLVGAGLIDKTETGFVPHNWDGRQFKSDTVDVTAAERMRRYRALRRNNRNGDASVTVPTDREQSTESESKKDSEANASGADAPVDHRKRLFDEGLPKLAAMTGKGPDACRSFVGKCLKAASDDAVTVLGLIEDAERNRVADPSAWIAARLKSAGISAKPLTEFQRKQQATTDVTDRIKQSIISERSCPSTDRVLPDDHRERPGDLRLGAGAHVLAISGASGHGSG